MFRRNRANAFRDNAAYRMASKAASTFDDGVHRGADAAASAVHQTAEQVGRASHFLEKKSRYVREQASCLAQVAGQHPVYSVMAIGVLGFVLGFALRGGHGRA